MRGHRRVWLAVGIGVVAVMAGGCSGGVVPPTPGTGSPDTASVVSTSDSGAPSTSSRSSVAPSAAPVADGTAKHPAPFSRPFLVGGLVVTVRGADGSVRGGTPSAGGVDIHVGPTGDAGPGKIVIRALIGSSPTPMTADSGVVVAREDIKESPPPAASGMEWSFGFDLPPHAVGLVVAVTFDRVGRTVYFTGPADPLPAAEPTSTPGLSGGVS